MCIKKRNENEYYTRTLLVDFLIINLFLIKFQVVFLLLLINSLKNEYLFINFRLLLIIINGHC